MKDSELFNILINLSILSPLFPLATILIFKLHSFRIPLLILILSVFSLATDIISLELAKKAQTTDLLLHFFTLISGMVVYATYYSFFVSTRLKQLILIIALGLAAFVFIEIMSGMNPKIVNFNSYMYLSLSVLLLALIFFFNRMNKINERKDIFDYVFWINSAFLLYYGSTLIVTLFENYIRFESPEIFIFIWPIQLVANIIFNLLLVKGLWTMKKM